MRWRISRTAALACALVLVACETGQSGNTSNPAPADAGSVGYPSVEAALEAVKARPGITESTSNGWTVYEDKAKRETWLFSPAGHPAHPAVVKRTSVRTVDGTRVQMAALCGGGQTECDRLLAEFQAADKKAAEQARPGNQPTVPSGGGARSGPRY
jgi:hypothetical protein